MASDVLTTAEKGSTYFFILNSTATPALLSFGTCSKRITVSKNLTFTRLKTGSKVRRCIIFHKLKHNTVKYEGWNFNSGNYLFTTDTK